MKRLHVHMSVEDIAQSVKFYSTLFATDPAVIKPERKTRFAVSRGSIIGLKTTFFRLSTTATKENVHG
jgi:predicted enzyme related to lactoylglutathione lyase